MSGDTLKPEHYILLAWAYWWRIVAIFLGMGLLSLGLLLVLTPDTVKENLEDCLRLVALCLSPVAYTNILLKGKIGKFQLIIEDKPIELKRAGIWSGEGAFVIRLTLVTCAASLPICTFAVIALTILTGDGLQPRYIYWVLYLGAFVIQFFSSMLAFYYVIGKTYRQGRLVFRKAG